MTSIDIKGASTKVAMVWDGTEPQFTLNEKTIEVEWIAAFEEFNYADFSPMYFVNFNNYDHSKTDYQTQVETQN